MKLKTAANAWLATDLTIFLQLKWLNRFSKPSLATVRRTHCAHTDEQSTLERRRTDKKTHVAALN
jgi:hypothetical protein